METVKFDHAVIYNGVLYPANTPIEVKTEKPEKKAVVENDKRTNKGAKSRNTD